jgi:GMP synthase (glutamine-hydrolysing)
LPEAVAPATGFLCPDTFMLRLLIADGNDRTSRDRHTAATGKTSAQSYAAVVTDLMPGARCRLVNPADADASPAEGLADVDGVIFTGSTLKVSEGTPEVTRQLALMRAAFAAGLPVFGSCWGVQVAATVAGGEAADNPRGPEYGFARAITPTEDGRGHPLLAGRPAAWDAPAIHSDAVLVPPPGARVLAGNRVLGVQAIEITHDRGWFWGTQYHPELDLDELAAMLRLCGSALIEAGLARDEEAVGAYAGEVEALHDGMPDFRLPLAWRHGLGPEVLEAPLRRREIGNFLERLAAGR